MVVVRSVRVRVVHLDGRCKSPADPQHHVAEAMHQLVDRLVEVCREPIEDNDNNKAEYRRSGQGPFQELQDLR